MTTPNRQRPSLFAYDGSDHANEEGLEQEAEKGAALARSVGFDATARVERGIPVWSGSVQAADDHDASVA